MGQVAPGHPSFVPQDCGQYDCINLQNLNVSLNVPVYSKSGAFPLNFGLSGADSYFYNNAGAMTSGILTVPLADSVNGVLGYYSLQAVYTATASVTCPSGDGTGAATKYSGWELINVAGTVHPLPSADAVYSGTNCSGGFTDQVIDGSGWTLNTVSGSIYSADGTMLTGSAITDSQSTPNTIKYSSVVGGDTIWTDTLGMRALTRSPAGPTWTWTDTNGSTQTASLTANNNATLKTSFGCSGITDENDGGKSLPTNLSFPDSTDLVFAWEPNEVTSTDYTGRLASITLRNGTSKVQFNYNPTGASAPYGLNCTYLVPNSLTRTTSDGTVTYNWTHLSGGGSQTTRLDIGKNETIYTFSASGILTQVQSFHNGGTITAPSYGGTADLVTTYCYNIGSAPTVSSCPTATVTEPISQLAVFTSPNGLSTSETYSTFDGYGNTTLSETWDYGVASTGTSLKETEITYGTVSGAGGSCSAISFYIHNKPCIVQVLYSGNTLSLGNYAYSSAGNLLTSYISPNGGTSYLSNPTANSYNSSGTPNTLYNLAGNSTAFTYSSSYYTDCSSCTQYPFPTKRVNGGLTTYAYYNGYGG
ncbi:MAG: hypothetical protein WBE31_04930, partial [Candidatus Sulfotelmatobacter sp.]